MLCEIGSGGGESLAYPAIYAHDTATALPPLKLTVLRSVVLNPIELLITVISL
jgi:hypothetical protein